MTHMTQNRTFQRRSSQRMQRTDFYPPKYSWTLQGVPEASDSQLTDFKNVFDSAYNIELIWITVKVYGIPDKIINIFRSL